jgi:hypothetical protein
VQGHIRRGAVGVEEGADVLVSVRSGYSDFMQPVFTRPQRGGGDWFYRLIDGGFRILTVAYEHNSTVEIADSRLQLADSVPLAKKMGWTRSMVGMRVTSFNDEGTTDTGNCAQFRLDQVTLLEADDHLKIPIASMELKLVFCLVHDVDVKEEKRSQMVDFEDSLVAVWINTGCSSC